MPGNIIPRSRVQLAEQSALSLCPLPNEQAPGSSVGFLKMSGAAQAGSTFVIDADNNQPLMWFAGYLYVPPPSSTQPSQQRAAHFKLYIDGKAVASKEVQYPVGN